MRKITKKKVKNCQQNSQENLIMCSFSQIAEEFMFGKTLKYCNQFELCKIPQVETLLEKNGYILDLCNFTSLAQYQCMYNKAVSSRNTERVKKCRNPCSTTSYQVSASSVKHPQSVSLLTFQFASDFSSDPNSNHLYRRAHSAFVATSVHSDFEIFNFSLNFQNQFDFLKKEMDIQIKTEKLSNKEYCTNCQDWLYHNSYICPRIVCKNCFVKGHVRINCPKILNMKIKEEKTKDEATEKPLESDENELDMINFLASDSFNQFVDEAKKVTNEKENDPRAPNKKRKIRKTSQQNN